MHVISINTYTSIDTEVHLSIDTEVHLSIDTEVHLSIDTKVHLSIDAKVHLTVDAMKCGFISLIWNCHSLLLRPVNTSHKMPFSQTTNI